MSGELSSYLKQLAGDQVESAGSFTVDVRKARDKLKRFQLTDPHEYACHFVAAAVARKVTRVDITIDADDLIMTAAEPVFSRDELEGVFTSLLSSERDQQNLALRELAIGLNAALGFDPTYIHVDCGKHRLVLAQGNEEIRPLAEESPLRIHVRERLSWRTVKKFWGNLKGLPQEGQALLRRCSYAPVQLSVNGEPTSSPVDLGPNLGVLAWRHPDFPLLESTQSWLRVEEPSSLKASVSLAVTDETSEPPWLVLVNGLSFETRTPLAGTRAVASCWLPKNVSQSELIEGDELRELQRHIKAGYRRLLKEMAEKLEQAPDQLRPSLYPLLRRALVKYNRVEALRSAPLFTLTDGSSMTFQQLHDFNQRHGCIYTYYRSSELTPLDGHPVVLEQPGTEVLDRWFKVRSAQELFDEALMAAENRQRWLQAQPRQVSSLVPCIATVELEELPGTLGLAAHQDGDDNELMVEFLKDHRPLGTVSYRLPYSGLVATVAPAEVQPSRLWDGVDPACLSRARAIGALRASVAALAGEVARAFEAQNDDLTRTRSQRFLLAHLLELATRGESAQEFENLPLFGLVNGDRVTLARMRQIEKENSGLPVAFQQYPELALEVPIVVQTEANQRVLKALFDKLLNYSEKAAAEEAARRARERFLKRPTMKLELPRNPRAGIELEELTGLVGLGEAGAPAFLRLLREQRLVTTETAEWLPPGMLAVVNDDELPLDPAWQSAVEGPRLEEIRETLKRVSMSLYRDLGEEGQAHRLALYHWLNEIPAWLLDEIRFDTLEGQKVSLGRLLSRGRSVGYLDFKVPLETDRTVLLPKTEEKQLLRRAGIELVCMEGLYRAQLKREAFLQKPPQPLELTGRTALKASLPEGRGEIGVAERGANELTIEVLVEGRPLTTWRLPAPYPARAVLEAGDHELKDDFSDLQQTRELEAVVSQACDALLLSSFAEACWRYDSELYGHVLSLLAHRTPSGRPRAADYPELGRKKLFWSAGGQRWSLGELVEEARKGPLRYLPAEPAPELLRPDDRLILIYKPFLIRWRKCFGACEDATPEMDSRRLEQQFLARVAEEPVLPQAEYLARLDFGRGQIGVLPEGPLDLEVRVLHRQRFLTSWLTPSPMPARAVLEVEAAEVSADFRRLENELTLRQQLKESLRTLALELADRVDDCSLCRKHWCSILLSECGGITLNKACRLEPTRQLTRKAFLPTSDGELWSLEQLNRAVRGGQTITYTLEREYLTDSDRGVLLLDAGYQALLSSLLPADKFEDVTESFRSRARFWDRPEQELRLPQGDFQLIYGEQCGQVGLEHPLDGASRLSLLYQGRHLASHNCSLALRAVMVLDVSELAVLPDLSALQDFGQAEKMAEDILYRALAHWGGQRETLGPGQATLLEAALKGIIGERAPGKKLQALVRHPDERVRGLTRLEVIPLVGGGWCSLARLDTLTKKGKPLGFLDHEPEVELEVGETVPRLSEDWQKFLKTLRLSLEDLGPEFERRLQLERFLARPQVDELRLPAADYLAQGQTKKTRVGLLPMIGRFSEVQLFHRMRLVETENFDVSPLVVKAVVDSKQFELNPQSDRVKRDAHYHKVLSHVSELALRTARDLMTAAEPQHHGYIGELLGQVLAMNPKDVNSGLRNVLLDCKLFRDLDGTSVAARELQGRASREMGLHCLPVDHGWSEQALSLLPGRRVVLLSEAQRRWLVGIELVDVGSQIQQRHELLQRPELPAFEVPEGLEGKELKSPDRGYLALLKSETSRLEVRWQGRLLVEQSFRSPVPFAAMIEVDDPDPAALDIERVLRRLRSVAGQRALTKLGQEVGSYHRWLAWRIWMGGFKSARLEQALERLPLFDGKPQSFSLGQLKASRTPVQHLQPGFKLTGSLEPFSEEAVRRLGPIAYLDGDELRRLKRMGVDLVDGAEAARNLALACKRREEAPTIAGELDEDFAEHEFLVRLRLRGKVHGQLAVPVAKFSQLLLCEEGALVERVEWMPELGLVGWLDGDLQIKKDWSGLTATGKAELEEELRDRRVPRLIKKLCDKFPEPDHEHYRRAVDAVLGQCDWTRPQHCQHLNNAVLRRQRIIPLPDGRYATLDDLFEQWAERERILYCPPGELPGPLPDLIVSTRPDELLGQRLQWLFETTLIRWDRAPRPKPGEEILEAIRSEFKLLCRHHAYKIENRVLSALCYGETPRHTFCHCDAEMKPVLNPEHPAVQRLTLAEAGKYHPEDLYLVLSGLYSVINRADPEVTDTHERAFHATLLGTLLGPAG